MREAALITFYDKKTEHRELKRNKRIHNIKRLLSSLFSSSTDIIFRYNLAEGLDLKMPIQVLLS